MRVIILSVVFCWTLLPQMAVSAPGDFDPAFGNQGVIKVNHQYTGDEPREIIQQPDGRILVAGRIAWKGKDFAVYRYLPDGTPDSSFGVGGLVRIDFGNNTSDIGYAMVLQPDGKIVVAGKTIDPLNGDWDIAVVRLLANGATDPSFGTNGLVITDISGTYDYPRAMALQPDGSIVITGHTEDPVKGDREFMVVRYTNTGSLDATFGTNGIVVIPFDDLNKRQSGDMADTIAIQSDGKIIVAGETWNGSMAWIGDFALARLNSDGTLDATFASGGRLMIDIDPAMGDTARDMKIQPDGKIVVCGGTFDGTTLGTTWHRDFALVRLLADGSLDPSFGIGGIVITDFDPSNTFDVARFMELLPGGKILAGGQTWNPNPPQDQDIGLARYNPDGSLDSTFGVGGLLVKNIGPASNTKDWARDMTLQSDGKILVAAQHLDQTVDTSMGIAVIRLLGDNPSIALSMNSTAFTLGDTVSLSTISNTGLNPASVDVWVNLHFPDGTVMHLNQNGNLTNLSVPMRSNWLVQNGSKTVFSYVVAVSSPIGAYYWEAGMSFPGSPNYFVSDSEYFSVF